MAQWGLEHSLTDAEAKAVKERLPPHILADIGA
jgi:hypothetical protein